MFLLLACVIIFTELLTYWTFCKYTPYTDKALLPILYQEIWS